MACQSREFQHTSSHGNRYDISIVRSYISFYLATRQLEALFNLSQLLFGLARSEQSNYTFRDLQLGQPARSFREAGFRKFRKHSFDRYFRDLIGCI